MFSSSILYILVHIPWFSFYFLLLNTNPQIQQIEYLTFGMKMEYIVM